MKFVTALTQAGYVQSQPTAIWMKPGFAGIGYSDGDAVEERIAALLAKASDLSVLSAELATHISDWPTLYHLSNSRANIARPFQDLITGADVLEIGAGCGALTRFFGESGAQVLALEGSPRRAAIARSRTRDLANVTVMSDRFDQFACQLRFDVVTLIGVLEYAALFTEGDQPAVRMLEQIRDLLKPDGKLIVAIENQLGLKYFAGAAEDHLNMPMHGIEGRYGKEEPRTFGRRELVAILAQAGFAGQEFLAPFPDYKLPVSIVTEHGLACAGFDATAFAWQSARRDYQLPRYCAFALELAWPEVAANGLSLDLANSFLVLAGIADKPRIDLTTLAYHYSTRQRLPTYCKETRFHFENDVVQVHYRLMAKSAVAANQLVRFNVPERADYVNGTPLSFDLMAIVSRDGWRMEDVSDFLGRYLSIVESLAGTQGVPLQVTSLATPIPGAYFDAVPQNILLDAEGQWHLIDNEWELLAPFPVGWLLYRTLMLLIMSLTRFHPSSSGFTTTRAGFMLAALQAAGFSIDEELLLQYGRMEILVQAEIAGEEAPDFFRWGPNEQLPQRVLLHEVAFDREQQIGELIQEAERRAHETAKTTRKMAREIRFWTQEVRRKEQKIITVRGRQRGSALARLAFFLERFNVRKRKEYRQLCQVLQQQPLLDTAWYLDQYPDVDQLRLDPIRHYIFFGTEDDRNPNPFFHTQWYLETYKQVASSGMNPLLHYLLRGQQEGTNPNPYFDTRWYRERYPQAEREAMHPLLHFIKHGRRGETNPNPYFDTDWYRRVYSDIAENDLDPLLHYVLHGIDEERDPGPHFQASWYLEQNPDVAASGEDPLLHFMQWGDREGRNPNPYFHSQWYRNEFLGSDPEELPPLRHFLQTGLDHGNSPHPELDLKNYLKYLRLECDE